MVPSDTSRSVRVREYMATPEFSRLWRYASVSVISTVLSLLLLFLFFNVAKLSSAAWSNFLATSITSVPAYYLNRTWAWGKTGKSHLMKEVVPFWTIAVISIVLSTLAVRLATDEAHHLTHKHSIVTLVVLAANFGTYAVLWVAKFIIFNKILFKNNGTNDPDLDNSGGAKAEVVVPGAVKPINTQTFTSTNLGLATN